MRSANEQKARGLTSSIPHFGFHSTTLLPQTGVVLLRGASRICRRMRLDLQEGAKKQWSKALFLGCILPFVIGLGSIAYSQATTGTLSGRITDPQGAVVPGATVQVLNADTNVAVTTQSNTSGEYVVPFLPPGTYRLVIRKTGFQQIIKSGVTLHIQETIAQDFVLAVGSVSQSVQVTTATPVMQTQSAAVGQVIDNKTISTLPLNGRDYTQLVTLVAGAAPNSYSRASNGFSLNGGVTFQTAILVNGLNNVNYILGTDTSNINALTPSPDAIQEFHVQTGNFSAEYGRSAGGVVSVVIKSGTNELHGDAYDFLRNDKLDANDYFAKRSGLARPPLRRNQFGWTLGGPIIRNHMFFFASYQGTRQASSNSGVVSVPTPEQYQEIQSAQPVSFGSTAIYNPFDVVNGIRQEFQENTIPTKLLDPVGLKIAALYPKPNLPSAVNNYGYNQSVTDNATEIDSRFDAQPSAHDTAFVTYSRGIATLNLSSIFAAPGNGGNFGTYPNRQPIRAWDIGLGETHIFSTSVVNDLRAGYTHNQSDQLPSEPSPLFQQFGINGIPSLPGLNGLPTFSLTGYTGLGNRTFQPNPKLVQITQGTDIASWIHGDHTVKFGGEIMFTHNYAGTSSIARGSFSFNGQFTSQTAGKGRGSALADLLLGQTDTATLSTPLTGRFRSFYYGLFIQDTWKATRSLTVDMGLRYDLQTPLWERDNRMTNFDIFPETSNYGTFVSAKSGNYLNRTFSNLDSTDFAPRLGLAYQLNSKTVIRAGAGVFNGGLGYQDIAHLGTANLPFSVSVSVPTSINAATSDLVLSNGFPSGILVPENTKNPSINSFPANFPMPKVDQWNLSIQRELPNDSSLTVAYVGSSSYDIESDNNLNAPPPGPGALNPRRPFPQYGSNVTALTYGHSTYEALQLTYDWRFYKNLSILSDYTWSKSLDNILTNEDNVGGGAGGPQNPNDTKAEKALSGFDVPFRFVTSIIYQLPVGKGHAFTVHSTVGQAIVSGWEVGGIYTVQHGSPHTPTVSPDPANNGTPARPDRLCNGNLPRGLRTPAKWYNPACFAPAAPYTFGNSARDVIFAPGLANLDFLVDRTFNLWKESRTLEFRSEFFNFTNSAHFGSPDMTVTNAQAGSISSDASPNREIEFALRLRF